jgi:hypothetical protein
MRYFLVGTLLPLFSYAQSQLGSGAISGRVLDPTGNIVVGAKVTVVNAATRLTRELTTNNDGVFSAPVLPAGEYTVKADMAGFRPLEQTGVLVNVGSTATIELALQVGSLTETVTVEAQMLIDTAKTTEVSLVDRQMIQDLPINGRRYDQFALLMPGVTRDGRFGLLSYRGQSGVFNNFMIEGNDDNQSTFGEARGRTRIAGNISANAIQEFQIGRGAFLAEFGRAAGGSVNAVVRSGANRMHADAFWYYRDQNFNARDPLASIRPDERRQQYGGSVSGPIKRDKVFYFVNYDSQVRNFPLVIEDVSGVLTVGRPTGAQATPENLAAFNRGVEDLTRRFPGGRPGNTSPRNANQWLGLAKVDWNLSNKHTLSTTYNQLYSSGEGAIQTAIVLGNVGRNGTDDVRIWSYNARLTSIVSPTKVNEFRTQWSRNHEFQLGDQPPPQVFVGSFSYGQANFLQRPAYPDERKFQLVDNFSILAGSHNIKFGGEMVRNFHILNNPANFGGTFNYANVFQYGRDLVNPTTRAYNTYTQSFGLPGVNFAIYDWAGFIQDQWKITRRLTLNYGLRYDFQQLPSPVAPNPDIPETSRIPQDKNNFGPRAGLSWDVFGKSKTVIRGGFGMYYGRTPGGVMFNALTQTGLTDPARNQISISLLPTDPGAPAFPNTLTGLPPNARASASVTRLGDDFSRPRIMDFTLGVDQKLARDLVLTASFIYTRGDLLPMSFDVNLPAPRFQRVFQLPDGTTFTVPFSAGVTRTAAGVTQNVNLSRPNPNFGAISVLRPIGETWYRALFLELKKRYAKGYQFNLSYTLAKAENLGGAGDGGGAGPETPFGGSVLQDQFNITGNRGTSPTDQRHRVVFNAIYNVQRGWFKDFRLSGIWTGESGRAFGQVINVPNIPFATPDGVQWNGFGGLRGQGGGADRNLLPVIERNSQRVQPNYRLDFRLARDFRLTERLRLEFLGEAFNLLNRSNFNGWLNTRFEGTATTVTTALTAPVLLTPNTRYLAATNNGSQPDGTNARRFQVSMRVRF